MIIRQGV
jgi:hypothetical protein